MNRAILSGLAVLALAGCGGSTDADVDGDGEVTAEEAQELVERSGGQIKPQPGKYRATMTLVNADIPGAPPEMVQMMSGAMGGSHEYCLTPEMADQGFEEAMKGPQDGNCKVAQFSIDGNRMNMEMTCEEPGAGRMDMSMNGTISRTSSEMTMVSKGAFGEMGQGEFEMNMKQDRIGECDG